MRCGTRARIISLEGSHIVTYVSPVLLYWSPTGPLYTFECPVPLCHGGGYLLYPSLTLCDSQQLWQIFRFCHVLFFKASNNAILQAWYMKCGDKKKTEDSALHSQWDGPLKLQFSHADKTQMTDRNKSAGKISACPANEAPSTPAFFRMWQLTLSLSWSSSLTIQHSARTRQTPLLTFVNK